MPRPRYDEKLATVTRALRHLTHAGEGGESLASGAFDAFPPPGLRLKGEPADLALAPSALTRHALDSHGKTHKTNDSLRYEVGCQDIEQRNPHWAAFVEKIVASVRAPLGISSAARVSATLRRLVLLKPGGRLGAVEDDGRRRRGVFGSLIVVLPGEFTGGGIPINRMTSLTWHPCGDDPDRNSYGITYGAFYNDSIDATKMEPITSGDALWLVYDLVTTTVHEVPRFASPDVLERAFEAALAQFFEALPTNKRLKIGDDAWRNIHEFAADHRFVYPVEGDTLRSSREETDEWLRRWRHFVRKAAAMYLDSPWCKHGNGNTLPFTRMPVSRRKELAPAGFVETLSCQPIRKTKTSHPSEHSSSSSDSDDSDLNDDDASSDNEFYSEPNEYHDHALVVQPATLERTLWARAPIEDTIARLEDLQATDPDEAVRLARCALMYEPFYSSRHIAQFMEIVKALNNLSLFKATLSSISQFWLDDDLLPRAVGHFRWESCVETIEAIIKTMSFSSGVRFVRSVLHDSVDTDRIDRLVRVLAHRAPWANRSPGEVADQEYYTYRRDQDSTVDELSPLLALAHHSSLATLENLLGDLNASLVTVHLLAPALVRFARDLSTTDRRALSPLVRSLRDKIEASLPAVRNASYARCPVYTHCAKCIEIHNFLVSRHAHQISITVRNKTQLKHIETTVKRKIQSSAPLTMTSPSSNTVMLTKQNATNEFTAIVEACVASLSALLV